MRPRLELKPTVKVKLSLGTKLLYGSAAFSVMALMVFLFFFFYGNVGTPFKAFGYTTGNRGFENNATDWAVSGGGAWSLNTANVRTGMQSMALTTNSGSYRKAWNNSLSVTAPAAGTKYITIIAWVKASVAGVALATVDTSASNTPTGTIFNIGTSWQRIENTFKAVNGNTYVPYLFGKSGTGASVTIYFDDVHIYGNGYNGADLIRPTEPSNISAMAISNTVDLTWTASNDAETGIDGVLILRQLGSSNSNQAVNDQAAYSETSSLVGPTSINGWTVVYDGSVYNSYSDVNVPSGSYTYLIYMRDAAMNYSSPSLSSRVFVTTGIMLPISLSVFEVEAEGSLVNVYWQTQSEMNNDYFDLERSGDANTFSSIMQIAGAGTSNSAIDYEAVDEHPLPGISYYRLKQVDHNGNVETSDVRMVNRNELIALNVSVFPNPSNGIFNITLNQVSENTSVRVYDMKGAMIYQTGQVTDANMSLDLKGTQPGMYVLKAGDGSSNDIVKQIYLIQ